MLGVATEVVAAGQLIVGKHANDDVVGQAQNQRAIGQFYEPGRIFVVLRRQLEASF